MFESGHRNGKAAEGEIARASRSDESFAPVSKPHAKGKGAGPSCASLRRFQRRIRNEGSSRSKDAAGRTDLGPHGRTIAHFQLRRGGFALKSAPAIQLKVQQRVVNPECICDQLASRLVVARYTARHGKFGWAIPGCTNLQPHGCTHEPSPWRVIEFDGSASHNFFRSLSREENRPRGSGES